MKRAEERHSHCAQDEAGQGCDDEARGPRRGTVEVRRRSEVVAVDRPRTTDAREAVTPLVPTATTTRAETAVVQYSTRTSTRSASRASAATRSEPNASGRRDSIRPDSAPITEEGIAIRKGTGIRAAPASVAEYRPASITTFERAAQTMSRAPYKSVRSPVATRRVRAVLSHPPSRP